MQILKDIESLQQWLSEIKKQQKTIGFVPTMGALHEGHLALIKASKKQNDYTLCSIFINPTQFNNSEDLARYPRTEQKDSQMLQNVQCDALFMPQAQEIYPNQNVLQLSFGYLETLMEGKFRPGHFAGVGLIVSKLFHLVQPQRAYFGQKDLQQCAVIQCLVQELNFPLEVIICPTIREPNGLAMSSRNQRLSEEAQQKATQIYQTLLNIQILIEQQQNPLEQQHLTPILKHLTQNDITIEYLEIVDAQTLLSLEYPYPKQITIAVCIAAYLEEVRLIDNILFKY